MSEYIIRPDDDDALVVGDTDQSSALHPAGYRCVPAEGWGDYRMKCGDAEVAVSFEEPGVRLIIEGLGSAQDAEMLAEAITAQLQRFSGRSLHLVPL